MSFAEDQDGFAAREDEMKRRITEDDVVERNGAYYVNVDGHEYPLGAEPDPGLTGHDLYIAQQKEKVWIWTLRFGLLGILIVIALIAYFALTK